MGSERAATTRAREQGRRCCRCGTSLEDLPGLQWHYGERHCPDCLRLLAFRAGRPYEVILNFQYRRCWHIHFIAPDCKTPLSRFFNLPTLDALRALVTRTEADPATLADFDRSVRAWGRGSVHLYLTPQQFLRILR